MYGIDNAGSVDQIVASGSADASPCSMAGRQRYATVMPHTTPCRMSLSKRYIHGRKRMRLHNRNHMQSMPMPARQMALLSRQEDDKSLYHGLGNRAIANVQPKNPVCVLGMTPKSDMEYLILPFPYDTSPGKAGLGRRPSVPSRTSSRRKALKHFTKELEKYAKVANAAGKLPVITPTESDEKTSLHTVKPLVAYMHEFGNAGLAVTSEQQRQWARPSIIRPHVAEYVSRVPPNPAKLVRMPNADGEPRFRLERDLAQALLPRPSSSMKENNYTSQHHHEPQFHSHHRSPPRRVHHVHGAPVTMKSADPESPSWQPRNSKPPRKLPTPAPELPYTWKYAVSNVSSLERALDVAQQRVEGMESQSIPPNKQVVEPEIATRRIKQPNHLRPPHHKHHPLLAKDSCLERESPIYSKAPAEPTLTKEYVNTGTALGRDVPQSQHPALVTSDERGVKSTQSIANIEDHSPKPHVPVTTNDNAETSPPQCADQTIPLLSPVPKPLPQPMKENVRKTNRNDILETKEQSRPTKYVAETPAAAKGTQSDLQRTLNDLDVFFDTDDAMIDDRDVLQGLQVAVKAAADDIYDALIHDKTGLRIRRFLADLKSIDIMNAELAASQPTRQRHTERKRVNKWAKLMQLGTFTRDAAPIMSPPEQSGGAAPKHRACDECRTRKLACTKEPDGCSRCKREGITCHYSPQKPMGRPRKRPRDETSETTPATESANKTPMVEIPPDTEDPGLAFLSFLTGGDLDLDHALPKVALDPPQDKADWSFGFTGNDFGQLNFDAATDHAPSFSASNIDPALFTAVTSESTPPEGPTPLLSSGQSSSPSSNGSPPCLGPTNCACIASLYLSIDSMQKLPNDITDAVRQARLTAKSAYQVVNCPTCSIPLDLEPAHADAHLNPQSIHNFQLLMLLSTLIPSIVHAYERILHLVDQETAKAQAERREIAFTLQNYGGMWGGLGGDSCGTRRTLEHRMMEPVMWRLTVRALLRVDVYGINACEMDDSPSADPFHLGLRDIVIQMENRSKARHAIMDPLLLSGNWSDPQSALKMHKTGETPTCQKIIQIAKTSIDNLVIA
ncbi:hypothetical protein SCUP234_00770 [Seiridium cupressi]